MLILAENAAGNVVDRCFHQIRKGYVRILHDHFPVLSKTPGAVTILSEDIGRHTVRLIIHYAERLVEHQEFVIPAQFQNQIMGIEILFGGVVIGILSLSAYILGLKNGGQSVGRTMAFAVLSLSQLFHSFNMRKGSIFSNLYLLGSFIICTVLQLSVMIVPKMMEIFKTVALSPYCWRMVILLSAASLVIGKISRIFKK